MVSSFNAADAIMRDAGLKDIFILAIDKPQHNRVLLVEVNKSSVE